jgi:hypothetical protein
MKPELSSHACSDSGLNCYERNRILLKKMLPLTTAIFFAIAPSPDSHDIAELTANFIAPVTVPGISTFKTGG